MITAFADSTFYVALLISRDHLHLKAKQLAQAWAGPVVRTEYVLLEVANHLCGSTRRERFGELLRYLRADLNTEIVHSTHELWERGAHLHLRRADKEWSLTDCISFVIMEERELSEALTADHHFEQAGFRVLLR